MPERSEATKNGTDSRSLSSIVDAWEAFQNERGQGCQRLPVGCHSEKAENADSVHFVRSR